ncbi:hypothetical protein BJY04DRAFT_179440 [Aspergillus karnatakaensis]|uniref:uncharacterized protein n=1 Tax=Aspergillus karnatakaensis TaxID=1810916 RepID=UPI003CCCACC3
MLEDLHLCWRRPLLHSLTFCWTITCLSLSAPSSMPNTSVFVTNRNSMFLFQGPLVLVTQCLDIIVSIGSSVRAKIVKYIRP